jgi:hypothetical protein
MTSSSFINWWLLVALAIAYSAGSSYWELRKRRKLAINQQPPGVELPDPFHAEVLLDGRCVAILSDRKWEEMFWRSYRIEAVDEEELRQISENDSLWFTKRLVFRDPTKGLVCTGVLPGGLAPYVKDGRVCLRFMYFREPEIEFADSSEKEKR